MNGFKTILVLLLIFSFRAEASQKDFLITLSDVYDPQSFISLEQNNGTCLLNSKRAGKISLTRNLSSSKCLRIFAEYHDFFTFDSPPITVASPSEPLGELAITYLGKTRKQLVIMLDETTCDSKGRCDKSILSPGQALAFTIQNLLP